MTAIVPKSRIAVYCDAVRAMREGSFSVSIPEGSPSDPLREFELELVRLAAWLDLRFEEYTKLQDVTAEIIKGTFLADLLDYIYDVFRKIIPYDRIGCALISDDHKKLVAHWAKTNYPKAVKLGKGFSADLAGSSLETILETGQPRILNDLSAYLRAHPESKSTHLIVAEGIQASLTCPLVSEGKPIGFLFFSSLKKDTYRPDHQKTFVNIARHVSTLVEKTRLYQKINDINKELTEALEELKERSAHDPVTGVLNRSAIMEFLQQHLQLAQRKDQSVAVIMIDLDDFKAVNDTFGHLAGDTALRAVATALHSNLRAYDRIGRFGGEEFLAILGDTDAESAARVAERMRASVAKLDIRHDARHMSVSVSMGVSCSSHGSDDSAKQILAKADAALYDAKRGGRNQIAFR